ncbi:MAG: ChaN family lipoprotein, partial [Phycisphaerales bacterium]
AIVASQSRCERSPRQLAMFHGSDGAPLDWNALWNGMRWADIVIVGEQHDDANAHRVQLAIWEEAVAAWPGSVVSLEMLERNEQATVDEYLAGTADVVVYGTPKNPIWRSFNAAPIVPETTAAPVREEEMPTWGFAY